MDVTRGFRRLFVFLTIVYWGMVVFMMINPPLDYEGGALFDPAVFLGEAAGIYGLAFGICWTLFGFYGPRRPRYDD